jgi:hypothetical protein
MWDGFFRCFTVCKKNREFDACFLWQLSDLMPVDLDDRDAIDKYFRLASRIFILTYGESHPFVKEYIKKQIGGDYLGDRNSLCRLKHTKKKNGGRITCEAFVSYDIARKIQRKFLQQM